MSDSPWADKIVITGTGRCGTTALMQILTAAGAPTGYRSPDEGIQRDNGSNSGMERTGTWAMTDKQVARLPRIIKDPWLALHLGDMAEQGKIPQHVIWCWRPLNDVAESRFAANRVWFPAHKEDLSRIPRSDWPPWVTVKNQERVMAEVLGRLTDAIIGYGLRHTTIRFPDDILDPEMLWRCLAGGPASELRHCVLNLLGWRTEDHLIRFMRAHEQVIRPELVKFG